MPFAIQVLLPAFLACLALGLFLGYLGMHVLAREVIFVDIALAQIAALGTAVADLRGIEPHTVGSYLWSLGFTFAGAALFALSRSTRKRIPQEAFIGIAYAVAAALSVLVANFLPHGDEEIREILIGNLLSVTYPEVIATAAIFAALGVFHWIFRKRFLHLSFEQHGEHPHQEGWRPILWDLAFYMSFGVVITSSVQMAGVLLVFSFLIVPAVFSALYARTLSRRLVLGWTMSAVVSAAGLYGSFVLDLPTGATVVVTFGIALFVASVIRVALPARAKAGAALGAPSQ